MLLTPTPVAARPVVLFVDDDRTLCQAYAALLGLVATQWQVEFVHDGAAAMARLEGGPVDTIVLDIGLPGRDGFAVLADIRTHERFRSLPVVILTGDGDQDMKRRALSAGADDLLTKPVGREDLVARIESMLRIKRLQDELRRHNRDLEAQVRLRTLALEHARHDIVWRLARAAELRDDDTGGHVARVAHYSRTLARQMGLDEQLTRQVFTTAPLHDVGKIGIPDEILLKPGRLTPEEFRRMQRHAHIGHQMLTGRVKALPAEARAGLSAGARAALTELRDHENSLLRVAGRIARHHHERWDGSGYPDGLRGDAIPLEAQIVAVADVYDALVSKRPYKRALPHHEAARIIRAGAGQHFSPAASAAFEFCCATFREIRAASEEQRLERSLADMPPQLGHAALPLNMLAH